MFSAIRRQTLQHPGELARGDQAVRLRCERTAHRLHGQLLCWNTLLHVGESDLRARAPTSSSGPIPTFLSSSLLVFVSPTLRLRFLGLVLILLPRGWGLANTRAMLSHTFPPLLNTWWACCQRRFLSIPFPESTCASEEFNPFIRTDSKSSLSVQSWCRPPAKPSHPLTFGSHHSLTLLAILPPTLPSSAILPLIHFLCLSLPGHCPALFPPRHLGSTCLSDMDCLFSNSRRDCRALTTLFSLTCGAWGCPSWSWPSADTPSPHQKLKSWKASSDGRLWMGPRGRLTLTCRGPDHRADP